MKQNVPRLYPPGIASQMLSILIGWVASDVVAQAQWTNHLVVQQTSGSQDNRYPRINNQGEVVYSRQVGGRWQVFSTLRGQLTSPDASWTDATSPAIADDGSFVCFRTPVTGGSGWVLRYPGPSVIEFSSTGGGSYRDAGNHPSMSSDGRAIWWYYFSGNGARRLFVSGRGQVSSGDYWSGDYPDVNAKGNFVYQIGGTVYPENRPSFSGSVPHLGDAPEDNPDIVYVTGTELRSTVAGRIGPGSWVDVNSSGIIAFEYRTNGYYHVFKGYPLPRIISQGSSNAVAGLPYKYDKDNKAEAYGYCEEDDPSGGGPIIWSVVPNPNTPPGFTIDAATGEVGWTPETNGIFRVTVGAENYFGISTQLLVISVNKPTIELVDAMSFRPQGSPDHLTDPNQYFSGGEPRVGVVADGASRLVLRVSLVGFEPSANVSLQFAIENASGHEGKLRRVTSADWDVNVQADLANSGASYKAVCIYESPMDYDPAPKPVAVQLHDGNQVIARSEILLKRPPVVLVHGTWSSPSTWTALPSLLRAQGYEVYLVNYEFSNGAHFSENVRHIFERTTRAVAEARGSGYAASKVDIVAHSMGGVLSRLHIQSSAIQNYNYGKGDVHKLITLGSTHWGSFWAGVRSRVMFCNPPLYLKLRTLILEGTRLAGIWPPVDLDGGAAEDQAPGSTALGELQFEPVPSHSVATRWANVPPDTIWKQIFFVLGKVVSGDGVVGIESARGGISEAGHTFIGDFYPGIFHTSQTSDSGIADLVVGLLASPVATGVGGRFGYFPGTSVSPSDTEVINRVSGVLCALSRGALEDSGASDGWLSLQGMTNGQQVVPGQECSVVASTTDGRPLESVMFVTVGGVAILTNEPFVTSFQVPSNAVGPSGIMAVGYDVAGAMASASVSLGVTISASLQTLEVIAPPMPLATTQPQGLRVWGNYSDAQKRDITLGDKGTRYGTSDRFRVRVDTNGVLRAVQNTSTPVTIWITNGSIYTNIQVTVDLMNLPPTAVIGAHKTNGFAGEVFQFDGSQTTDPDPGPLSFNWDFGDGTTNVVAAPAHCYTLPGHHVITLTVSDNQGLISIARSLVTIEPRLVLNGTTAVLTAPVAYDEAIITNGGVLTVSSMTTLDMTVSNRLVVNNGSSIDASGAGYPGGPQENPSVMNGGGPCGGCGFSDAGAGGGSHGGLGGSPNCSPPCPVSYGSFLDPMERGSGGGRGTFYGTPGNGGAGGGAIRIRVKELVLNGNISADGIGSPSGGGGGAGGSIRIDCDDLSGSGVVRANGGSPMGGGGGGGGRVAVAFQNTNAFSGRIEAFGGRELSGAPAHWKGAAGTIFLKQASEPNGTLIVDNAGSPTVGWSTPIAHDGPFDIGTLVIGTNVAVDIQFPLTFTKLFSDGTGKLRLIPGAPFGDVTFFGAGNLTLSGGAQFRNLTVSNGFVLALSGVSTAHSIEVTGGGVLAAAPECPLRLIVTNYLLVGVSSALDASGKGYPGGRQGDPNAVNGSGPGGGMGPSDSSGGCAGGYGGVGAPVGVFTNFGQAYGSFFNPADLGSGGGRGAFYSARGDGGAGGGSLWIQSRQVTLDGEIRANGVMNSGTGGGGGSGGSIKITCEDLLGNGAIRANGGTGAGGYGGGGGRVAVFFGSTNGFSGRIEAVGGEETSGAGAYWRAGAGTVFLKQHGQDCGKLIIDNAGRPTLGWSTPLTNSGLIRLRSWTVTGDARVSTPAWIRVTEGNPALFAGMINSTNLQVGGLIVSNTWVCGDIMDLEIGRAPNDIRVTLFGEPGKPHILQGSTDFTTWIPLITNGPVNSRFEFLDTNARSLDRRFYRGVKPN